ncbi:hypothetical protein ACKGJY_15415 [Hyunsoonleella sp. 2307UL5-6]|uniref:hypothetical protein n=1 Tax=Hyunsoonleella sp. 2307UL5-6 TaxID=3384768 RepID=UPI0039BC9A2A
MKRIITSFLIILVYSQTFGQITTREIAEKAVLKPRVYDSLSSFKPREDLRIYIGQDFYFLPKSKKFSSFRESDLIGYQDFSIKAQSQGNMKERQYHPVQGSHKYDFKSDYNSIAGHYFRVEDYIEKDDKYAKGFYFKLFNKKLKDTAFYELAKVKQHINDRMIFPFIVVGSFEKLKSEIVGKKLQAQEQIENVIDINSGQTLKIEKGSWWECIDFTLVELENNIYLRPALIFRNDKFNEIMVEANDYQASIDVKRSQFMTPKEIEENIRLEKERLQKNEEKLKQKEEDRKIREAEWAENDRKFRQKCISEFGAKYGNYIADGKVVIGMTEKMCRIAWGNPIDINTTTTNYGKSEQWVYSLKHYLYFDNGKLTAIQN